jgi:hypothetical protein
MNDALFALEDWYHRHCNGVWEHNETIQILAVAQVGWQARINLYETEFDLAIWDNAQVKRSANDRMSCTKTDSLFQGSGDLQKLNLILLTFFQHIEAGRSAAISEDRDIDFSHVPNRALLSGYTETGLTSQLEVFCSRLSTDSVPGNTLVQITTLDNPGWKVVVDLQATRFADMVWESLVTNQNDEDWLRCEKTGPLFRGAGDAKKLSAILRWFLERTR